MRGWPLPLSMPGRSSGPVPMGGVLDTDAFVVDGWHVGALELAPVALELLDATERVAVLDALAGWYDAIGRPFLLLSLPARRDPAEHLAQVEERVPVGAVRRMLRPYAALVHETAAGARMPHRRAILSIDAATSVELRRAMDATLRVAQERGILVRPLEPEAIAAVWASVARPDDAFVIGAREATG